MPKGKDELPSNKKEERDHPLTKVLSLAPLVAVILQFLELMLKIFGVIQ